jgi:hypothetical protein
MRCLIQVMFLKMRIGMMIKIEGRIKARHMSSMAGPKNHVKVADVEKETS